MACRHLLYQTARAKNPARCSRYTRNWSPSGAVALIPEREVVIAVVITTAKAKVIGSLNSGDNHRDMYRWACGMGSCVPLADGLALLPARRNERGVDHRVDVCVLLEKTWQRARC